MEAASDHAESLARRVAALKDPAMRIAYVRHELAQLDPGELCDLLAVAAQRADTRQKPHVELLLAMAVALDDEESARQRRAAVAVAAERGQSEVVELLSHGIHREEAAEARVPDFGAGRPLTLGERKALARKNDRELIARVLRDPHRDVIRILLTNPALVERDVVHLCARRPVSADVIREVFRSPRWMVRYEVRRAIVLNPYTPLSISMRLSRLLTRQDAHRVAESSELHADLRAACRRNATGAAIH